jgi:hypothetical protein
MRNEKSIRFKYNIFNYKCDLSMRISPIWRLTSVRTVDPHWGDWLNSSAVFNPKHHHVNAALKQASLQTTSRQHHHATPNHNYCT